MNSLSTWSLSILTLPTENATARMRFWRALLRRLMRRLRKDYESIVAIDFFPTEAATRAEVAWQGLTCSPQSVPDTQRIAAQKKETFGAFSLGGRE